MSKSQCISLHFMYLVAMYLYSVDLSMVPFSSDCLINILNVRSVVVEVDCLDFLEPRIFCAVDLSEAVQELQSAHQCHQCSGSSKSANFLRRRFDVCWNLGRSR